MPLLTSCAVTSVAAPSGERICYYQHVVVLKLNIVLVEQIVVYSKHVDKQPIYIYIFYVFWVLLLIDFLRSEYASPVSKSLQICA